MKTDIKTYADKAIELGKLVLAFGRTERRTRHEDGIRPETDTDHTVMLGILACAYAKEVAPHLNLGLIAQFALVHDLVEVYAGDTMTFKALESSDREEKEQREKAALDRIRTEFGDVYPWIHESIEAYESLETPEARFVKMMDKSLPGLTHSLNGCIVARELGHTAEDVRKLRVKQRESYLPFAGDQPEALELWKEMCLASDAAYPDGQ